MVEDKEVCIKAGKTAGGIMRFIIDTVKKTGKFGEAVINTTEACVKTSCDAWNTVCAKGDNFIKRIGYGSNLACW